MALTFNEGAYGQAYQQGQDNEQADKDRRLQMIQQFGQLGQGIQQVQDRRAKFDQDKKLYELKLADAQSKGRDENTLLGQLLSSNSLSQSVAPSSMLDKIQAPQGMGEAANPMGQQRGGMIEKFRQFKQGRLRAPQVDMSSQALAQPDMSAFGLPPEAANMTMGQVRRLGEAKKLFAEAGQDDYYTPEQAKAVSSGDINQQAQAFNGRIPKASVKGPVNQTRPPAGFQWTPSGELQAIPGGPADIKLQTAKEKEGMMTRGLRDEADLVINKVDQALSKVGLNTAGLGGSIMSRLPGTEATDLEADVDTIKAVLGFNKLSEMRRSSPTGGALGNVSDRELKLLTAARASLDQKQSPDQLRSRLTEIKTHYQNWLNTLEGISPDGQATQTQQPNTGVQPMIQRNKKTGQQRQSFDGGRTWQAM